MEFEILGPVTARSGARALAIGGGRPRALLALLLTRPNQHVSVERLALELFGEDAPEQAVKTVRVNVSRLRTALEDPDVLVTTPSGYRLRVGPDELDADRFEHLAGEGRALLASGQPQRAAAVLRAALALWRGPAFADVDVARGEAERLDEARL